MDPANQIHDFNPGITPSGLFWTIPVSDERVRVDLDDASAALKLEDADVEDYTTLGNALADGPSVPAEVSFHVRWQGVERRVQRRDPVNTFTGSFIEDLATIRWSAHERGFRFTSDPAHTSSTTFAEIGTERNGVFFS